MTSAALVWMVLFSDPALDSRALIAKPWTLSRDQQEMLARIARFHDDFHVSSKTRVFYETQTERAQPQARLVEMVFEQDEQGLYCDEFVSYSVTLDPEKPIVHFAFDAGSAHRGYGTILVTKTEVIRTMTACGSEGCTTAITVNGNTVYSRRMKP